jgi:hypothetical protein
MRPGVVIARAICLPAFLLSAVFVGTQCNSRKAENLKTELPSVNQKQQIEPQLNGNRDIKNDSK